MDFPVKNPFRPGYYGGPFVTKLAPGGASVVYSTVVGDASGSFGGQAEDIAIDATGNAYITGSVSYATLGGMPQGALPMVELVRAGAPRAARRLHHEDQSRGQWHRVLVVPRRHQFELRQR